MQLPPSSRAICFVSFSFSASRDLTRFQITFALVAQGNLVLILVWVRAPSSDPKARKRHCSWSDSSHPVWLSLSATPESFGPWTSERISYLVLGIIWAPNPLTADVSFFFFFSFPGREREFRDMPERPPRLPVALEAIGAWLKWSSSFSFRSSSATCPPPSSRLWTRKLNVPVSGHIFDLTNYHGP